MVGLRRGAVLSVVMALVAAVSLLMVEGRAAALEEPVERFPHLDPDTRYVDDFGVFARDRIHMGIDIFSPKGTPVVAVADGFVARMSRGVKAGYYIVLRHGGGWSSYYLHLNDDLRRDDGRGGRATAFREGLAVGDYVEAGSIIGYVGDSGNAEQTPPHTHFELHLRGRQVDPYPYVHQAMLRWQFERDIEAGKTNFR